MTPVPRPGDELGNGSPARGGPQTLNVLNPVEPVALVIPNSQ